MKLRKYIHIQQLADQLGATFDTETDHPTDRAVIAVAPDGKQWADGQCIHMVEVYYTYIKGSRDEALDMLYTRMKLGIEDLDTELNP